MKTREEMFEYGKMISNNFDLPDVSDVDAEFYVHVLDNMETRIQENNELFVATNSEYLAHSLITQRKIVIKKAYLDNNGIRPAVEATLFDGGMDFGHSCPDWNNVLNMGIVGLRARAAEYASRSDITDEQRRFYNNIVKVYDAGLRYMDRAAGVAEAAGKMEMAQGIRNLTKDKPQNLREAMQILLIFYMFQHTVECTLLRTFGRLDQLLYPFYKKEADKEKAKKLIQELIDTFDVMDPEAANIPFALGGLDPEGNDASNELSYLLLDAYLSKPNHNVKLHLMCSDVTPKDLVEKALDGVRKGNNSICFFSDATVIKGLMNIGATEVDARNYAVLGCYESAAFGEVACTSAGKVNGPKALELALYGGQDILTGKYIGVKGERPMDTYEDVFAAFEEQLRAACRGSMATANHMESHSPHLHSAPFYSSTFDFVMESGGDIFNTHSAKYNNTSIIVLGLATCVDSLVAIKKLVFEDKKVTLEQFKEILRNNWEGAEPLRQLVKNRYPKYGQADPEVDAMANQIMHILSDEVNNKPNTKGGVFRLGVFSITWRWGMGEKTAASADGRLSGETLSLNTGASFGATKYGATAHLLSVGGLDNYLCPDGSICDIDLHASAVAGDNGLNAMRAALETYFEKGGFAVHYNVLDAEVLKAAKKDPTLYPDLQVRLCGWNELFSSLSEKEKDEFIERISNAE